MKSHGLGIESKSLCPSASASSPIRHQFIIITSSISEPTFRYIFCISDLGFLVIPYTPSDRNNISASLLLFLCAVHCVRLLFSECLSVCRVLWYSWMWTTRRRIGRVTVTSEASAACQTSSDTSTVRTPTTSLHRPTNSLIIINNSSTAEHALLFSSLDF